MSGRLVHLLAGLVFGAGLALCRMIDPARVLGFLDVGGAWDPALAATMAGAVGVTALLYRFAGRLPPRPAGIDARLLIGSLVFGAGWGLAGMCPAPALAVAPLAPHSLIFFAALVLAVYGVGVMEKMRR
jgi:uncharacterized membrane protein YedE/YeeE